MLKKISRYTAQRLIGVGTYGEVYEAWDPAFERKVAIKILKPDFARQHRWVARFEREAKLLWKVRNPHVLQVFDVGRDEGVPFIVTELLRGQTLRERLQAGPFSIAEALRLGVQAAQGIRAVHDAGIVLRDVKPENLFLCEDGSLKVLDFGLAKFNDADSDAFILSDSADVLGTTQYMSPEQLFGEALDRRTDIFSLAVTLYEMIAGRRPWADRGDERRRVLREEPTSLANVCSGVPIELAAVLHKALDKDPKERFQSMMEFGEALKNVRTENLLTQQMVSVKSESSTGHIGRFSYRTSGIGAVQSLITIAILAALTFAAAGTLTVIVINTPKKSVDTMKESSEPARPPLRPPRKGEINAPKSLAILPFVNATGNKDFEYLADAIPDTLTSILNRDSAIGVTTMSSVNRYIGRTVAPSQVTSELHVGAVIEGKVSASVENIVVKIQLSKQDDRVSWNRSYEAKLDELAALERKIANDIANHFQIELNSQADGLGDVDGRAYRQFLRGRYHFGLRTVSDLNEAIKFYRQALEIEPRYALAHAGIAECYIMLGSSGYAAKRANEVMPLAKEAALKAIEYGPTLAGGHAALALVRLRYEWDRRGAEEEFRKAIELNPDYATAHLWYANLLAAVGRWQEALSEINQAKEKDPDSAIIEATAGQISYFARDYAKAIGTLKGVLEAKAGFYPAVALLGFAYEAQGDFKEAIKLFENADDDAKNNPVIIAALGYAYAKTGRSFDAMRSLRQLNQLSESQYVPSYTIATIYIGLGNNHEALRWLRRAYEEKSSWLVYLEVEPLLDPLRSDPHFESLVESVGLRK